MHVGLIRGEDDEWDVELKPPSEKPKAIGCLIVNAVFVLLAMAGFVVFLWMLHGAGP